MIDSKLVKLHKTLTVIEKKRFAEYLESPFFNTNEHVISLNKSISKAIESDVENALDKKKIYGKLFSKSKYDDQRLRNQMAFLTDHLEKFIALSKFQKKKLLEQELLLTELRERNLDTHFISSSNEFLKTIQQKKIYDADYFYEKYVLEKELDHYFIKKEVRKSNESLQHKSDSLDTFYLSEKLKNLCDMVNRKNIIAAEYNLNMMSELMEYIHKNSTALQSTPAIFIYYKILLSLLESDVPKHFKDLKQALHKYVKAFSKEELRQMFDYAENYCIKKINSGTPKYLEELFSIYEELLSNEIIFENNYLSQADYKNIVSTGLKLEKFDWTKKFIEHYKERIAPEFRKNAYEFNLATYYYNKKEYKSALKLLQVVEFTDVYYHLSAKFMLLKMYFEIEDVEPFYSLVDAYKVYLVRNKNISKYQRQVHQNIVKYTKQAFDLKLKGTSLSPTKFELTRKKLQEKIDSEKNDANLSWLQERLAEL